MHNKKVPLLYFDGGDLFFSHRNIDKNEQWSACLKARVFARTYRHFKVDALLPGEIDFALGRGFIKKLQDQYALPVIGTNLIDQSGSKIALKRVMIKKVGSHKLAILGLVNPDYYLGVKGIVVQDPFDTARKQVEKLKTRSDFIVVISHLGFDNDLKLARQIKGIDIIFTSHDRRYFFQPRIEGKTMIVGAGSLGKYMAVLDLRLKKKGQGFLNYYSSRKYRDALLMHKIDLQKITSRRKNQSVYSEETAALKAKIRSLQGEVDRYVNSNCFRFDFLQLGDNLKDDPTVKTWVDKTKAAMAGNKVKCDL